MENPTRCLSQKLRTHRRRNHLTQQQAADAMQIKRASYASYEEGRAEPPFKALFRIARVLDLSLDELLGYDPTTELEPVCCPPTSMDIVSPVRLRQRIRPEPAVSSLSSNRPFVTWP